MTATQKMAEYVNEMGISINTIAKKTGLSTNVLYPSLSLKSKRQRELRVDEFLAICFFLDKDPRGFYKESDKEKNAKVQ